MKCFRTLVGLAIAASGCLFTSTARAEILASPNDFSPSDSVITFQNASTALPYIPGVQFPDNFNGTTGFSGTAAVNSDLFGSQIYGNEVAGNFVNFSDLAIVFSSPQPAVGAYAGKITNFLNKSPSSLQVSAFDASNNLLDSTTLELNPVPGGTPISFVGFSEPAGISRIEWSGGNGGFFGVDNVTYGTAVPEPTSLTIVGLGMVFLLSRRRRHA